MFAEVSVPAEPVGFGWPSGSMLALSAAQTAVMDGGRPSHAASRTSGG